MFCKSETINKNKQTNTKKQTIKQTNILLIKTNNNLCAFFINIFVNKNPIGLLIIYREGCLAEQGEVPCAGDLKLTLTVL